MGDVGNIGRLPMWNVNKAARFGNACGNRMVTHTHHGCSIYMPTTDEVMAFAKDEAFYVFLTGNI
jgi:sugar/nucleoside kinase (ribokinase family)